MPGARQVSRLAGRSPRPAFPALTGASGHTGRALTAHGRGGGAVGGLHLGNGPLRLPSQLRAGWRAEPSRLQWACWTPLVSSLL
jgi:hypothetical protein